MTRRGRLRGSTARTFLAEARHRGNLKVETDAIATRLLFEGKRCVGVAFRQNGVDRRQTAAREVILSRRRRQLAASLADFRHRPGGASAVDRRAGGARSAGGRRQPERPLRRAHLAPGTRRGDDQPAGARAAPGARGRALGHGRRRRADLRRHLGDGVLPQPRGAGEPRPAIAVHAGELRPGRVPPAGARARHDRRGLPGAPGKPRHDHGANRPTRSNTPRSARTTCRRRAICAC